jgi:ribosomal protein S18 acetylase RimI-like enzyme
MIRAATVQDLDALVALERQGFASDQLDRRRLRYMITRANASLLVDGTTEQLRGYALVLFHRRTALARLYSIAVDQSARGHGLGRALLRAAEAVAVARGCVSMRAEIRRDNDASRRLFTAAGYRPFEDVADYYEDHMAAVRRAKR